MPSLKIGEIVTITLEGPHPDPRSGQPIPILDYPAIIYKIFPILGDSTKDQYFVGLYVFTDDGLKLLRKVPYSPERRIGFWR